jgi:hypothetical protein
MRRSEPKLSSVLRFLNIHRNERCASVTAAGPHGVSDRSSPPGTRLATLLPSAPKILRNFLGFRSGTAIVGGAEAPTAGVVPHFVASPGAPLDAFLGTEDWAFGAGTVPTDAAADGNGWFAFERCASATNVCTVLPSAAPPGTKLASAALPSAPKTLRTFLGLRTGAAVVDCSAARIVDGAMDLAAMTGAMCGEVPDGDV